MSKREIFVEALQREDPRERSEFLEGACGHDAELRRNVDELLAEHERADSFFIDSPLPSLQSTLGQSGTESPGTQIGPYRLLRQLGRGGMGVVYEAEQISLGRRVALKILPFAALLNETQLERFATEATAAARLQHSSVVTVYSVGCERGIHFIAMQLIDGTSLAQVIAEMRQERQPDDEQENSADTFVAGRVEVLTRDEDGGHCRAVARIGREAAEALHYAHENGVLHRDIKPSNLLLDKTGHVWIADFGLARVEDESQLTRTGDILGTLHYMSPEQATGQRDQIDARSDVYGLGATLYELAILRPVFDNEDRREVIKQVVAGNPVAPHKIDSRIPRPLSLVISKAMARSLDERYQTAQELADDLQRFLDGETVQAKAPSKLRRARAWSGHHRLVSAAIVGLLIVALTAPISHHFFTRVQSDSQPKGDVMKLSKAAKVAATVAAVAIVTAGVNAKKPPKPPPVTVPNPSGLGVIAVAADSITLDWTSGGGSTAGFIVAYLKGTRYPKSNLRGAKVIEGITEESHTVPNLLTDQIYSFRVCAIDSNGKRSSGVTIQGTTVSGAEVDLLGSHRDPDTVIFGWRNKLIKQEDGYLYPGYYFDAEGNSGVASILRWNDDGTVDTSFGNDGKGSWIHDFGEPSDLDYVDEARDVVQAGDKLVVVGVSNQYTDAWIARLNLDGSFDTLFGDNGIVEFESPVDTFTLNSVIVLSDGIIAAGLFNDPPMSLAFVKFTSDGDLDTSFGNSGFSVVNVGLRVFSHSKVYQAGDGGLLIAGSGPGLETSAIYKVDPSTGGLVTTFGNSGIAEIDFEPGGFEVFEDLAIRNDGKIVAVGGTCAGENVTAITWGDLPDNCSIARFNADGTVDTTFAMDGGRQLDRSGNLYQVELLSDDSFVAFGMGGLAGSRELHLARFTDEGSLDQTFDGDGWVNFNFEGDHSMAGGMVVLDDLKYLVGATGQDAVPSWTPYLALVRQLP